MRVFVQGDRDAKGCQSAATEIAMRFRNAGVSVNLGAYGKLVSIFLNAGCDGLCHGYRSNDQGECPTKVKFIDCAHLAPDIPFSGFAPSSPAVAWGVRLGILLETSDAFLFFAGRQGTIMHAVPAIGFGVGQVEKGQPPKKVALVGWCDDHIVGVKSFFFPDGKLPAWIRTFGLDETEAVFQFLVR